MRMILTGLGAKWRVEWEEDWKEVRYMLFRGKVRKLIGTVQKIPGWKKVWADALDCLAELATELNAEEKEKGDAGLRSHAFQQTPSDLSDLVLYHD